MIDPGADETNPEKTADMKRILALDGGGVRGTFSLAVLAEMENVLRSRQQRPDLVLADYFDFIAGTSTGAIIAALLSWGESVEAIRRLYEDQASNMFRRSGMIAGAIYNSYSELGLSDFLQKFFVERAEDGGGPALFGTRRLRTKLLVVVRNATTGSAWPLCNHAESLYNDPALPDCNLRIPLWQLVRASAAAPTFFRAQEIAMGKEHFRFIDGGITPYNNPAHIAYLLATLDCYRVGWETGEDRLHLVSVGTGRTRTVYRPGEIYSLHKLNLAVRTIRALIQSSTQEQDLLCRVAGRCLFAAPIDAEIGDLIEPLAGDRGPGGSSKKFTYVRYNTDFAGERFAGVLATHDGDVPMDDVNLIPLLRAHGEEYARANVRDDHLR